MTISLLEVAIQWDGKMHMSERKKPGDEQLEDMKHEMNEKGIVVMCIYDEGSTCGSSCPRFESCWSQMNETKKKLERLIEQRDAVENEIKQTVKQHLVGQKKIDEDSDADSIAYKKIIREEFGLVI
jgi:predicted XRE-type DNA-binding protein